MALLQCPSRHLLQSAVARGFLLAAFAATILVAMVGCDGEKAPDFEVELFDGQRFRLSDGYAKDVIVVNFWYPSCPPCRDEMPEFQQASEELSGEPVRFLGLFVPRGFDTEATAREFVDELGLTFDFATDREETIAAAYGVEFYPTTWFIDRGGEVGATHVSALDAEDILATVRELLAN